MAPLCPSTRDEDANSVYSTVVQAATGREMGSKSYHHVSQVRQVSLNCTCKYTSCMAYVLSNVMGIDMVSDRSWSTYGCCSISKAYKKWFSYLNL